MSLLLKQAQIENEINKKVLTKKRLIKSSTKMSMCEMNSQLSVKISFSHWKYSTSVVVIASPSFLENPCCQSSGIFVEIMNVLGLPLKSNQRSLELLRNISAW
jgi:hypothetical protein